MGVRGLTTYIKANGKKFLKNYKLHNCCIIIDGYNVATNLFISLHSETAFGGNYDIYALHIKHFFTLLKKCKIKPLVVFDGGYEKRKLDTVYKRMRSKILSAKSVSPRDTTPNFPLFMRHIFREVLIELDIPYAQCDFEADVEIAALARELQCPVLSYDSDFYIFDVMYIPYPTLLLEASQFDQINMNDKRGYYLKCKLYEIDNFLDSFGGLNRTMLPLLAAVLGNDYINRSVFRSFLEQFKVPTRKKKNPTQVLISALLQWLRNETLETAVCKILGRMKQHKRKLTAFKINSVIKGYTKYSSCLDVYLSIQTEKKNVTELDIDHIMNQVESTITTEEKEENYCLTSSDCESSEEENEDDYDIVNECGSNIYDSNEVDEISEELTTNIENEEESFEIPDWLIDSMRKGNIHSSIMDILTLRVYFCPVQVEDYSLLHSHKISLPILRVIVGLLLGHEQRIRYWARNQYGKLEWFSLDSVAETKSIHFPSLEFLNQISLSKRKLILLEALGLEDFSLDLFPHDWQIFVLAILFWLKNMSEPIVTFNHLHTLVMCIVVLQVITTKIGFYRNRKDFMKKYRKQLKKLTDEGKAKLLIKYVRKDCKITMNENGDRNTNLVKPYSNVTENFHNDKINDNKNVSVNSNSYEIKITKILNDITREECILMFEKLSHFHCLNDQLKSKPKLFSITSVHCFAIFQSCLHHSMLLNSLLGFPIKQCVVSKFFSGLFAYNIFSELNTKRNIDMYIHTLFENAPSLLTLYEHIFKACVTFLPSEHFNFNVVKGRRKKKKSKSTSIAKEDLNIVEKNEDEDAFLDENNKFSLLAIS